MQQQRQQQQRRLSEASSMATCQLSQLQKENVLREKARQKRTLWHRLHLHPANPITNNMGDYCSQASAETQLSVLHGQEPEPIHNK